tara:strand:+ start:3548 stop:4003 length:456 start_codon:yes stop_codon:yes gene_type:complete
MTPELLAYLPLHEQVEYAQLTAALELAAAQAEAQQVENEPIAAAAENLVPGVVDLVQQAIEDPLVNNRNFAQWIRCKLPAMGDVVQNTLVTALYFLFVASFPGPDADAQPGADLDPMRRMGGPLGPFCAPYNAESVVDAVFAKAERKSAAR